MPKANEKLRHKNQLGRKEKSVRPRNKLTTWTSWTIIVDELCPLSKDIALNYIVAWNFLHRKPREAGVRHKSLENLPKPSDPKRIFSQHLQLKRLQCTKWISHKSHFVVSENFSMSYTCALKSIRDIDWWLTFNTFSRQLYDFLGF